MQGLPAALAHATLTREQVERAHRALPAPELAAALARQLVRVRLSGSYALALVDGLEDLDESYTFAGQVRQIAFTFTKLWERSMQSRALVSRTPLRTLIATGHKAGSAHSLFSSRTKWQRDVRSAAVVNVV